MPSQFTSKQKKAHTHTKNNNHLHFIQTVLWPGKWVKVTEPGINTGYHSRTVKKSHVVKVVWKGKSQEAHVLPLLKVFFFFTTKQRLPLITFIVSKKSPTLKYFHGWRNIDCYRLFWFHLCQKVNMHINYTITQCTSCKINAAVFYVRILLRTHTNDCCSLKWSLNWLRKMQNKKCSLKWENIL